MSSCHIHLTEIIRKIANGQLSQLELGLDEGSDRQTKQNNRQEINPAETCAATLWYCFFGDCNFRVSSSSAVKPAPVLLKLPQLSSSSSALTPTSRLSTQDACQGGHQFTRSNIQQLPIRVYPNTHANA
eukprot:4550037-Amphidinium_carterae.2